MTNNYSVSVRNLQKGSLWLERFAEQVSFKPGVKRRELYAAVFTMK